MPQKIIKIAVKNNFQIIGIIEKTNDFKLVWLLNNILNINLIKSDKNYNFSVFEAQIENFRITLIENKLEDKLLFKEIKDVNFLLKISSLDISKAEEIVKKIKSSQKINFAMILPKDKFYKKSIKFLSAI